MCSARARFRHPAGVVVGIVEIGEQRGRVGATPIGGVANVALLLEETVFGLRHDTKPK